MVKRTEDAEELTQDIFMKIYNGLSEFRGDAQIKTWIYRIIVNTCLTRLNSKSFKDSRNYNAELSYGLSDSSTYPEEIFLIEERKTKLETGLNMLPGDERQLLLLFYIDELSYKEIGEILELPVGTVGTKIFRARQKLKEIMLRELKYEM